MAMPIIEKGKEWVEKKKEYVRFQTLGFSIFIFRKGEGTLTNTIDRTSERVGSTVIQN